MTAPAVNGDGVIADPLTDAEYDDLERLETVVSKGLDTFVEVGNALAEIRDRRLYRQYHASFDAYCKDQWDIGRSRAYRLIQAAEVVAEMSPMGNTPTSERQARELKDVPPEERSDVMAEAGEDGPVTAKKIRDVVTKRTESPARGREVREETVTTDPAPERDSKAKKAAERADEIARTLTAYPYQMVDERTVRRLEAWCQRWRNQ